MTLSIVIVNWNVRDLLEKCLASIYRETRNIDFEVIVVDNASKDGSVEMIKKKFSQVRLIENKENRWFSGGNNQGFAVARGKLILLLNPDTEILDGAIEKMVNIMGISGLSSRAERHPASLQDGAKSRDPFVIDNADETLRNSSTHPAPHFCGTGFGRNDSNRDARLDIGILGCKLLNSDMTLQPSCRRLPRLLDQILILLKLHNFFPRLKPIREYYMTDFNYDETYEVEQVMGACLMTRKEIIDKIGGLDEGYGSIFEEVDFCKRVLDTPLTTLKRGTMENSADDAASSPSKRWDTCPSNWRRGVFFWKIYFTPEAKIIHHKGQSFRQRKIITNQKNFNSALSRYFKKYKPFWQYWILLALWPINMFLVIIDQIMLLSGIRGFKAKFKKYNF